MSDSKSALQALQSGSKNRQEIQAEIHVLFHNIISKGTDLHLSWIPSHIGITGNEKADTAAEAAASLPLITDNLRLSRSEMNAVLKKHTANKWYETLQTIGAQRGWLIHPTDPTGQFLHPPLPPNLLRILRRIRTNSCVYKIYPHLCDCGNPISFIHLFQKCPHTEIEFAQVITYAQKHNLKPHEFLLYHNSLSWEPVRLLCRNIYISKIGHLF